MSCMLSAPMAASGRFRRLAEPPALAVLLWRTAYVHGRLVLARALPTGMLAASVALVLAGCFGQRELASLATVLVWATVLTVFGGVWNGHEERALRAWVAPLGVTARRGLAVAVAARLLPLLVLAEAGAALDGTFGLQDAAFVAAAMLQLAGLATLLSLAFAGPYNALASLFVVIAPFFAFQVSSDASSFASFPCRLANPLLWQFPVASWHGVLGALVTGVAFLAAAFLLVPGSPRFRAPAGSALAVRGVRRSFGPPWRRREVLHGVTFELTPGRVTGLLGRNGAGKTTTLRVALGLLRPGAGDVHLRPGSVRYLPEEDPMAAGLPPRAFLSLLGSGGEPARWQRLAELLHVADLLDRRAGTLSAGQRRRCALFLTAAAPAEVYLLDEPSAGVDPLELEALKRVLRSLRDEGASVLVSTHLLREFDEALDDVVLIEAGRVIVSGDATQLRQRLAAFERADEAAAAPEGTVRNGKRVLVAAERREEVAAELSRGVGQPVAVPVTLHDVFVYALERAPAGQAGEAE